VADQHNSCVRRTQDVERYNAEKLASIVTETNPAIKIQASHRYLLSNGGGVDLATRVRTTDIPTNSDDCGGLHASVTLAVGAQVMLRRNIHTADGLVNGAVGTITGFRYAPDAPAGAMPEAVMVQFDNPRVGRQMRAMENLPIDGPVPIPAAASRFKAKGRAGARGTTIERRQFPLTLSWASTIHKVQGLSMVRSPAKGGKGGRGRGG
jgi:hypothetical protein